ncbi:MAG TPA: hypothetical protein VFS47_17145, partial [Steroidobacteraceae bacterium]|nr:hypothetical protein [Steroidobacteraceae bacterium]
MNVLRIMIAACAFIAIAGASVMSEDESNTNPTTIDDDAAAKATASAQKLLDALPDDARQRTQFTFDASERLEWNYVPMQR